jgi:2,3-bisphosphoglycerate-dependent phosphoglycerate mutase
MRKLILIRHSVPVRDGAVPASQWRLSEEGRGLCEALAARLAAYEPVVIVSSVEPKAMETAQIVAGRLGIPWETMDDLHEHERPLPGLAPSREAFEAQVIRLLQEPGELVFGAETGEEARERFAEAIEQVLDKHRAGNVAVVTHGTVMSLFVSQATGIDPARFWQSLGLPAFAVLSLPDLELLEVAGDVASPPPPETGD